MFAKLQQIGTIHTEIVDCNQSDCSQFLYSQRGKWDGDDWMVIGRGKSRQGLETPPLTSKLRATTFSTHYLQPKKSVASPLPMVRLKEKKPAPRPLPDLTIAHRRRCIRCASRIEDERRQLKLDHCRRCADRVEKKVGHMIFDHKTAPYIQVIDKETLEELRKNSRRG